MNRVTFRWQGAVARLLRAVVLMTTAACQLLPVYAVAAEASSESAPPGEDTFEIREFRVLGNTVMPKNQIETAVYPFLGPNKTIHTIEQARDALVAAYRQGGFGTVLVDIPEQSVDDGIVRLKVTEGRIQKVRVRGARYYSERRILAELPSLKPGAVPQLPELQAQLSQLANQAHDRQITPVLKAGDEPGTVAIDLNVKDRLPLHASIEADDRYTADTAHTRATVSLSYDNLFQRGQSLSAQYQTAPGEPSQVKLWVLTYGGRTPWPEWTWSTYAIRSESNVAALGTLAVIGDGRIFGARLVDAFSGSESGYQSLTFGVDYKDFGQTISLPGNVNAPTPIHYLIWSGQYAAGYLSPSFDATTSLSLNFAIHGLGGNDAEFEFKRSGASSDFIYFHGTTNLTWRVWHGVALGARLTAQYSEQPLVSNEQFSIGGADTVRGYLEAEELVDAGITGNFELRAPPLKTGPTQLTGYLFYDRGIGMIQQPLSSEVASGTVRTDLYSFGIGVHLSGPRGLSGSIEWADPRVDGSRTLRGHSRALFSVLFGF